MNSKLMNLKNMKFKDIMNMLPVNINKPGFMKPSFMGISGLSRTWGIAGLVVLSVGALAYPAFRLYKMLAAKKPTPGVDHNGTLKSFVPSYRGKHKPHHRKVENEGGLNLGLS